MLIKSFSLSELYIFFKRHTLVIFMSFTCFVFLADTPPNSNHQKYKDQIFSRLLTDNKSLLERFRGERVLVSFFNFYGEPFRNELISYLKTIGILIYSDDRNRVKDIDPLHESNIQYCINRGIFYSFSGISDQRAQFKLSDSIKKILFRETEAQYQFYVNDLKSKTKEIITLSSKQKLRFHPLTIFAFSIMLWPFVFQKRYKNSLTDAIICFICPVIFCKIGSSINSTGISLVTLPIVPTVFTAILAFSKRSKSNNHFYLIISFIFALEYLVLKLLSHQWDVVISIFILIFMASPVLIRTLIHVPYLRPIIIQFKNLETFYLENIDKLTKEGIISYFPKIELIGDKLRIPDTTVSDLKFYLKWIVSQIPIAIALQITREFMNPDTYYLIRSKYGQSIMIISFIKGIVNGSFETFIILIALGFFCVRPITLFRVYNQSLEKRNQIISINKNKVYLTYSPKFVSIISILLGLILTISYFQPWISIRDILIYFEVPIWHQIKGSMHSGFLISKSVFTNRYLHYFWPALTATLIAYGFIYPIRKYKISLMKETKIITNLVSLKLPYYLLLIPKELIVVIASLLYIVLPAFLLLGIVLKRRNQGDVDENNHFTSLGNSGRRFLCLGKRD